MIAFPTVPGMISLEEARATITAHTKNLGLEHVPLESARGRVLAETIVADAFYPDGDRSTMDGYGIGAEENPGEFLVVGEIPADGIPNFTLGPRQAARIFTGGLLPQGCGRVVPQEETQRDGDNVTIPKIPNPTFIRHRGSEANPGDILLDCGNLLGPTQLAILAQIGAVNPSVIRQPIIRHLATGDEIVPPETTPAPGKIRDTNSTLIAALISEMGLAPPLSMRVGDNLHNLTELAKLPCDVLLISGGASVGDHDHGAESLRRAGFTIHFNRVNLRPGKPLTFATKPGTIAFVIPGNPVSHFVCFHVAIRLALEILTGRPPSWHPATLPIHGGATLTKNSRDTFWPAKFTLSNGNPSVTPLPWSTSGDTFSLAGANALARIRPEETPGNTVETHLLPPL